MTWVPVDFRSGIKMQLGIRVLLSWLTEGCPTLCLQGRGVGSTRKKQDTAALEDRDKPYACDSEWGHGWGGAGLRHVRDPGVQESTSKSGVCIVIRLLSSF